MRACHVENRNCIYPLADINLLATKVISVELEIFSQLVALESRCFITSHWE